VIDLHFFDREGNPLPGVAPTTLHVEGGALTGEQLAAIQHHFKQFTTAYRLGLPLSRRAVIRIGALTTLELSVNQGVFQALARTGVEPGRDYFGGLVLRFERLTEAGQAYLTDHGEGDFPDEADRETIPFTLSGPRRVPGSLGDGATEWLLMQIARNGDLTDQPVRNGLVKLFRIANPLIGNIASHNYSNRRGYIMTADWSTVGSDHRASAFYLCGRNTGIPAAPVSTLAYSTDMVRMFTFGFDVADFARPGTLTGTIVLVWWGTMWIYRTSGGGWQQVTESPVSAGDVTNGTLQPFGYDFEVSGSGGSTVLTCSGANTEGQCSEFEVRIGATSVTGSIDLRTREHYQAPAAPVTPVTSIVGSWINTIDTIAPVHVDGGPGFNETYVFTDGCFKQSSVSIADGAEFASGSAAVRDPFLGGVLTPARGARYYELAAARVTGQTNVAEYVHSYVVNGLGADIALPHFGFDQPYSVTASITLYNTVLGTISYSFSSSSAGALDTSVVNGTIGGDDGIVQSLYSDRTWSASFPMSGSTVHQVVREYSAIDNHRKRLAWRHDATRTATWTADLESPGQADGFLSGLSAAPSYTARLVDRTLATVAERANFLDSFNGLVTYSGLFTFNGVPAFCSVPTVTNDAPSRPQGVGSFVPLFNTKVDGGTIAAPPASLIGGFWFQGYLAHFNDLGSEHTIEVVPESSGPPAHTNVFDDDEGTWSVEFDGNAVPTFNLAGYESMSTGGAIEVVPVPGFDWPSTPSTTLALASRLNLPDDFGNYYQAPSAQRPRVNSVDDRVYVDPRTDGYVAQSFWDGEMEVGGDYHASIQTLVGNDDSVTTLEAVINEAAAMAGLEAEYSNLFIRPEVAKDVALI
jgi:hypothetical protein